MVDLHEFCSSEKSPRRWSIRINGVRINEAPLYYETVRSDSGTECIKFLNDNVPVYRSSIFTENLRENEIDFLSHLSYVSNLAVLVYGSHQRRPVLLAIWKFSYTIRGAVFQRIKDVWKCIQISIFYMDRKTYKVYLVQWRVFWKLGVNIVRVKI
jgi:hypothetical protein